MSGEIRVEDGEVLLNLVKCGMCGTAAVVSSGYRHICDRCREPEHKLYRNVKTLILENLDTGYTIQDAAEILKVEESKIQHLVNSGFFKLTMRGMQVS